MAALGTEQQQRLDELLRWVDRWRAAQRTFFAWTQQEWDARLERYARVRDQARAALFSGAQRLPMDRVRRISVAGRAGQKAKWAYRRQTDRVLGAAVQAGEEIFGIKGERNAAGIYIGALNKPTRKLALAQLRLALKGDSNGSAGNAG